MPEPVALPHPRTRRRRRPRKRTILRTARIAALSAAATLVLLAAGLAAWWGYSAWRLGRIELTNTGPMLTVQVLGDRSDQPIGGPVEVFRKLTLALPHGDYRLRVDGEGRLGRTYRFAVNRGETIAQPISLDEGRLLGHERDPNAFVGQDPPREEPLPFSRIVVSLELEPGKADLVEFTGHSLIRRDGETGQVVWDAAHPKSPHDPGHDPARWLGRIGIYGSGLTIVQPAVDLDADGTRDVLLAYREQLRVPRVVGSRRIDALESRRRRRRPRRSPAGGSRASRSAPAGEPAGRPDRPSLGRGRRRRRHRRHHRHDDPPRVSGGGRAADRPAADIPGPGVHQATGPGDLRPIGAVDLDLSDRPGLRGGQ